MLCADFWFDFCLVPLEWITHWVIVSVSDLFLCRPSRNNEKCCWLCGMHVDLCSMARHSNVNRVRVIGFIEAGWCQKEVARWFDMSRLTVSKLQTRFRATECVGNPPRSGRPRLTTRRQDLYIEVQATQSLYKRPLDAVKCLSHVQDQKINVFFYLCTKTTHSLE